jgi:2-oxoglutarate dehydrogenase E2 component (dihydrolipoamide succinyltransferase)
MIAEHMVMSKDVSPHAHTVHEVDFTNVVEARKQLKSEFAERGVKLTYTAFLIKAAAEALREYPTVNASMDGDDIVLRGDINIGMAVALDQSLIVPVIKNADELSLLGVARSVADIAERARNKRLSPDEVKNGTFSVSNHGVFGPEFGIPIINQPQAAIVSTGAIKKRVVVDQQTDAIMVRPTSIWCLSFDHRIVDGATADKFMAKMRNVIETWDA